MYKPPVLFQVYRSSALPLLSAPQDILMAIAGYVETQMEKAALFETIGDGLCDAGALIEGLDCLERSRSIHVVLGHERGEQQVLLRLGQVHQQMGRDVVAICCFMEALTLSRRLGLVAEVETLQLLAAAYEQAGMSYSAADAAQQVSLLTSGSDLPYCNF